MPSIQYSTKNPENSWKNFLENEFQKSYFQELQNFLETEISEKKVIYPAPENIFSAFEHTPLEKVKVVILGQDPYHGENQAHGLSFSIPKTQKKIPPSLKNIFKEIQVEFSEKFPENSPLPENGNLERWADQGVFLLNATLTVEAGKAGSHQKKGWEIFTDQVIREISEKRENIIFLLWGSFAQKKSVLIDEKKHCIFSAPHPSPLSSYRGFFGCEHFKKTNIFLEKKNIGEITW